MRRTVFAAACALAVLAFISCGERERYIPPPAGSYSRVVLVTQTGTPEGPAEAMVRALQRELDYYTKNEFQFGVKLVPAAKLEEEIPVKNMVLFGLVNQGKIGSYIQQFIGADGVAAVYAGKAGVFKKMDYPVDGQLTLIVTAGSNAELVRIAEEEGPIIRDIIEDANRERLRGFLLRSEDRETERIMRAKYGFGLRVPVDYSLNQDRPEVPGIEIINPNPDRGISVTYREWPAAEVSLADSSKLYDWRADYAYKMYDKDVMRRELVRFSAAQIGPYPAVRMEGYWENSVEAYGGVFVAFFVADRVRSRLWMIDGVVFAPGRDKHEYVRELHAVAETFRL